MLFSKNNIRANRFFKIENVKNRIILFLKMKTKQDQLIGFKYFSRVID